MMFKIPVFSLKFSWKSQHRSENMPSSPSPIFWKDDLPDKQKCWCKEDCFWWVMTAESQPPPGLWCPAPAQAPGGPQTVGLIRWLSKVSEWDSDALTRKEGHCSGLSSPFPVGGGHSWLREELDTIWRFACYFSDALITKAHPIKRFMVP